MNTNEILLSMGRYLHAMYDIEIDTNDPKLHITLKEHMKSIGKDDESLKSYWEAYVTSLTGQVISKKTAKPISEEKPAKEIIYRGQVIEPESKNSAPQDKTAKKPKKSLFYRGQKVR